MRAKRLERRPELLKFEGNGLEPAEIVKELSVKYAVTCRSVFKDFETREVWLPLVPETVKAQMKVRNRHGQLYRKTVIAYVQAKSDGVRLACAGRPMEYAC
jgi:hypothetical protein